MPAKWKLLKIIFESNQILFEYDKNIFSFSWSAVRSSKIHLLSWNCFDFQSLLHSRHFWSFIQFFRFFKIFGTFSDFQSFMRFSSVFWVLDFFGAFSGFWVLVFSKKSLSMFFRYLLKRWISWGQQVFETLIHCIIWNIVR
jgi:hypothetical protein